jgi:outer membrane protein assembly factor BamE
LDGINHSPFARFRVLRIGCRVDFLARFCGVPLSYNQQIFQKEVAMNSISTAASRILYAAATVIGLSACAGYGVHKIDIQQGNLVTQEQLAKVKTGMNRVDVKNILGTPLLQDVFNGNRWDYAFSDDRGTKLGPFGRDRQKYRVTIVFANDAVEKIEGEASPVEILTGGGDKRVVPKTTPPGAPTPPPKS